MEGASWLGAALLPDGTVISRKTEEKVFQSPEMLQLKRGIHAKHPIIRINVVQRMIQNSS